MEFSYVFTHMARQFHGVFHTETHGVSMETFTCFCPHRMPWGIKPGPLFCRIAPKKFNPVFPQRRAASRGASATAELLAVRVGQVTDRVDVNSAAEHRRHGR